MGHTLTVGHTLVDILLLPVGVGLAVGSLVAVILEPRWATGGLVWFLGYPKNVEIRATLVGMAAVALTGLLVQHEWGRRAAFMVAPIGWIVAATQLVVPRGWPLHLAFVGLTIGVLHLAREEESPLEPPFPKARPASARMVLACGVVLVAMAVAFLGTLSAPRVVNVFEDGQVLVEAIDLVDGGQPHVTERWAHGVHDAGIAAWWMDVTDKGALSPVSLARATNAALGVLAVFLLAAALLPIPWAVGLAGAIALAQPVDNVALAQLGRLPFAAAAVLVATRARLRTWQVLAAGAAAGLQHLFRAEAGVYTLVAVGACLAWRASLGATGWAPRIGSALRAGTLAVLGFAGALVVALRILGWSASAWIAAVSGRAVTHGDVSGLPMPWPTSWSAATPQVLQAYALPAVTALLVIGAIVALAGRWSIRRAAGRERLVAWLVFVAVFAAAAVRTIVGRSDAHVTTWSPFVAVAVICLLVRAMLRWARTPVIVAATMLVAVVFVDLRLLRLVAPADLIAEGRYPNPAALVRGARAFDEHVRANPPDACGARWLTASELDLEQNRRLTEAWCDVERTLAGRGLERVLYPYAAPLHRLRLGTQPPDAGAASSGRPRLDFNGATSLDLQEQLVMAMSQHGLDAVLEVRGFGALHTYSGVNNAVTRPLLTAYLIERWRDTETVRTPLGTLHLVNAATTSNRHPVAEGVGDVIVHVDEIVRDGQSGLVLASGWAYSRDRMPLVGVLAGCPEACGHAEYGLRRPDVVTSTSSPDLLRTGWELTVFLTEDGQAPTLVLIPREGPARELRLDLATARELPERSGAEWRRLRERVREMTELGRRDRASVPSAVAEESGSPSRPQP